LLVLNILENQALVTFAKSLLSLFLCKYKHKNTISYLQVGLLSGAPENLAQEVSKDFILFSFQNQRGKRVHINKYFKKDKSHQKY
jgi:hypothetical protein